VQSTETVEELRQEVLELVVSGDIDAAAPGGHAVFSGDSFGPFSRALPRNIDQHRYPARAGDRARVLLAQQAGASGDHRHPPGQVEEVHPSGPSSSTTRPVAIDSLAASAM